MSKTVFTKKISLFEKALHWLVLLSFLGLCTTGLAAEYFFSKEAIMNSFKLSLPMVNADIAPADQFFIARLLRRNTWDVHFYFGVFFGVSIVIWLLVNLIRKRASSLWLLKLVLFGSGLTLAVSGTMMFVRLYISLSEDAFGLLKHIHYYAYWTFISSLVLHIAYVIYVENKITQDKGNLSKMVNFNSKSSVIVFTLCLLFTFTGSTLKAETHDFTKWANDKSYIDGVLYLEGQKGAAVLLKEISNCPYDKCKNADVDNKAFGSKTIGIKKPDYKKAVHLLSQSSANGNVLASNKLLEFLTGRIDYKSKNPSGYLLKQMKEETGLDYSSYKKLVTKTVQEAAKTNKSCYGSYLSGELHEVGALGYKQSNEQALLGYKKAFDICPEDSLYKMMAQSKINKIR